MANNHSSSKQGQEQNHKSRIMLAHELGQIRKYMYSGASNRMIIDLLKIPERTFYSHLEKIAKEDLEYQLKQDQSYMASHINRTREGLLKLERMALDLAIKADTPHGVKIEAMKFVAELEISLLKLEHEGTTLFQVISRNGPNKDRYGQLVLQSKYLQSSNGGTATGGANVKRDTETRTTKPAEDDPDRVF